MIVTEPKKLSEAEKEAILEEKRRYNRRYYQQNKKKLRQQHKEWREKNPEKVRAASERYWLNQAMKKQG